MQNGRKFLKTNLFKWTADYDNAANQFNQAAMAFKGAGMHKQAVEANELAIDAYLKNESSAFQAAKCMEQAALSFKELGDFKSVSIYYNRAIDIYRQTGNTDTAISTLDRAAKSMVEAMPFMAADLFIQASEACVLEDRHRQAAEYCSKAAVLFIKMKDYHKAVIIGREEINCCIQAGDTRTCSRVAICLILVHLANKNPVGAHELIRSCQLDDDTLQLAEQLVSSFEKSDYQTMGKVLNNSYFMNLDTEYAKLSRQLFNEYCSAEALSKMEDTQYEEDFK